MPVGDPPFAQPTYPWPAAIEAQARGRRAAELEHESEVAKLRRRLAAAEALATAADEVQAAPVGGMNAGPELHAVKGIAELRDALARYREMTDGS